MTTTTCPVRRHICSSEPTTSLCVGPRVAGAAWPVATRTVMTQFAIPDPSACTYSRVADRPTIVVSFHIHNISLDTMSRQPDDTRGGQANRQREQGNPQQTGGREQRGRQQPQRQGRRQGRTQRPGGYGTGGAGIATGPNFAQYGKFAIGGHPLFGLGMTHSVPVPFAGSRGRDSLGVPVR